MFWKNFHRICEMFGEINFCFKTKLEIIHYVVVSLVCIVTGFICFQKWKTILLFLVGSAAVFDAGDKEISFGNDNSDLFTGVSPAAPKVLVIVGCKQF